ncbi:hypothetical protein D9M71_426710 [compost metagenome]
MLDHLFEQSLGALLHQFLGARTRKQCIEHQGGDHRQHAGSCQGGDGELDGPELHVGSGKEGYACGFCIGSGAKFPESSVQIKASRTCLHATWLPGFRADRSITDLAQMESHHGQAVLPVRADRGPAPGRMPVSQYHQRRGSGCRAQAVHVQHAVEFRAQPDVRPVLPADAERGVAERRAGQEQRQCAPGRCNRQAPDRPDSGVPPGCGTVGLGSQRDRQRRAQCQLRSGRQDHRLQRPDR